MQHIKRHAAVVSFDEYLLYVYVTCGAVVNDQT